MLMRSYPILSRFLFFVVLPLVLMVAFTYGFLSQSLPKIEGTAYLSGLKDTVEIIRDEKAIPHITATTDYDAFFSLGYLHAQDRIWQMNFTRRLGQGRLSEIMGRRSLANDRYMRTLGLYKAAKSGLESLDPHALEVLTAYSNGVNAWISEGNTLPIEFHILDTEPELWQPVDSILVMKLMAFNLGVFNFNRELTFDLLVKELGIDKANELRPNVNTNQASLSDASELIDPQITQGLLAQSRNIQPHYPYNGEGIGSNAWAVSGKFTESGLPLLASDPHLALEIPSVWYLAKIKGDRLNVIGATYPGVPAVFMGRNDSIAWGITNMLADAQDYYVESVSSINEDMYEVDGEWLDMEIDEEIIHVKSDFPQFLTTPIPPIKWQVRKTRHGPLISDAIGRADRPLAMRWSGLDDNDKSFQGFLDINYANDWDTSKASFEDYTAPAINIIYADVHGDIGLFAAGKIPIRNQGDGRLPAPGWKSSYEWDGYISPDSLPQVRNPEKGYVVNANNRNHPDDYPYIIANTWSPYYRVERIRQSIQSQIDTRQKIGVQSFIDLQGNQDSLQVQELLGFLRNLTPEGSDHKKAINQLKEWNGSLSKSSEEALIYQVWLKHFNVFLTRDDLRGDHVHEARGDQLQGFVSSINPKFVNRVVHRSPSIQFNWCDQINTTDVETCEEIALMALDAALDEIHRFIGSGKRWGEVHKTYYPHQVFSRTQLLDVLFDREIASGGDRYTVNSGNWDYSQENGYRTVSNSNYRQVVDLNDWRKGGFINDTGQSGNVLSRHYDDNILPFKQLKLWPMQLGTGQVSDKDAVLTLEPAQK